MDQDGVRWKRTRHCEGRSSSKTLSMCPAFLKSCHCAPSGSALSVKIECVQISLFASLSASCHLRRRGGIGGELRGVSCMGWYIRHCAVLNSFSSFPVNVDSCDHISSKLLKTQSRVKPGRLLLVLFIYLFSFLFGIKKRVGACGYCDVLLLSYRPKFQPLLPWFESVSSSPHVV